MKRTTQILFGLGPLAVLHFSLQHASGAENSRNTDRRFCLYQLMNSHRVLTPDDRGLVRSTDQNGMTDFFIELALSLREAKPDHDLSKGALDALRVFAENEFVDHDKLERNLIYLVERTVSVDGLPTPILSNESVQEIFLVLDLLGKKLAQPPADSDFMQ
jgi:hypothetical protein